jgi:FdhD protein
MGRSRSVTVLVRRHDRGDDGADTSRRAPDVLAVEEPMEIRLDGHLVATTMRTPGHDYELAVGWCHTGGLLAGAPVSGVRYCATAGAVETAFNVVTIETAGRAPVPTPRLTTVTSSCGLCGAENLAELSTRLAPLPAGPDIALATLAGLPERVRPLQELFATTGAVHAAAAFDIEGTPLVVREDVGRHNAVDKVVGRLLLDGALPATELGLFVSGRASFELVQKAWTAGFTTMVAVSAPTALAVDAARAANLRLVGFVRPGRANVYAPA